MKAALAALALAMLATSTFTRPVRADALTLQILRNHADGPQDVIASIPALDFKTCNALQRAIWESPRIAPVGADELGPIPSIDAACIPKSAMKAPTFALAQFAEDTYFDVVRLTLDDAQTVITRKMNEAACDHATKYLNAWGGFTACVLEPAM